MEYIKSTVRINLVEVCSHDLTLMSDLRAISAKLKKKRTHQVHGAWNYDNVGELLVRDATRA